jgi:hypothetical protein
MSRIIMGTLYETLLFWVYVPDNLRDMQGRYPGWSDRLGHA